MSSRTTASSNVEAALGFATVYLDRARVVEQKASADNERHTIAAGGQDGLPCSPLRDPVVAANFLLELFAFVAGVRTTRDYIYASVARSSGESNVRNPKEGRLATDAILFHKSLGNHTLHQSMIAPARTLYRGGDKDGAFAFSYRVDALDEGDGKKALEKLQADRNKKDGMNYSILELASLVLSELKVLHRECLQNRWYRDSTQTEDP